MKNHANLYLGCLILLLFTAFSCKKEKLPPPEPVCPAPCYSQYDVPGLPPVTDTGEGTLGFLLNGEPWVAQGYGGGFVDVHVAHNENTGYLGIRANRKIEAQDISQYFTISVPRDVFEVDLPYEVSYSSFIDFRDTFCNEIYKLVDTTFNKLAVYNIDTEKNIISCSFQVMLEITENCQDTITISNGRVDSYYESY